MGKDFTLEYITLINFCLSHSLLLSTLFSLNSVFVVWNFIQIDFLCLMRRNKGEKRDKIN